MSKTIQFRMLKDKVIIRKLLIPLIIIFQLILNTSVGLAWIIPRNSQTIPYGITVGGQKVGGLNRDQAVSYLAQNSPGELIDKNIVLKNGPIEWCLHTKEFNFRYDCAKTIDIILKDATAEEGFPRMLDLVKLQARNQEIPAELSWNKEGLDKFLHSINEEIMIPPRNASLNIRDGKIAIVNEQAGEELDLNLMTSKILESIQFNELEAINIVKKDIQPSIVNQDITAIDCVLASFVTEFNNDQNRTDNIILASRIMDGTIIMPGNIFSFNQIIGERNLENGFKKAPVIINGYIHQDVGGGICQVATTLYNASLLAGLEIIERSPHSIPVKYAPHGLDATVFYGQIDLKIKNNMSNPVIINSVTANNDLEINIYGNHMDKENI